MAIEPTRREQEVRHQLALTWAERQYPATKDGEDLLAERQRMEARHAIERRQWETRLFRYLMQVIKPLEGKKKAAPPHQEQEAASPLTG